MTRTIQREHADLALARFWADQGKDRHLLLVPGQTAFVHPELDGVDCQAWFWRTSEGWTKHMNAYHRGHGCLLSQHKGEVDIDEDGGKVLVKGIAANARGYSMKRMAAVSYHTEIDGCSMAIGETAEADDAADSGASRQPMYQKTLRNPPIGAQSGRAPAGRGAQADPLEGDLREDLVYDTREILERARQNVLKRHREVWGGVQKEISFWSKKLEELEDEVLTVKEELQQQTAKRQRLEEVHELQMAQFESAPGISEPGSAHGISEPGPSRA